MSEKAERRRQREALNSEKTRRDLLIRDLLNRADGREFIWWLLQVGKYGVQPFAADSHITAFSCGELNVGQQVFAAVIEADPAGFLRMQQEINDARSANSPKPGSPGADASDDSGDDAPGSDT